VLVEVAGSGEPPGAEGAPVVGNAVAADGRGEGLRLTALPLLQVYYEVPSGPPVQTVLFTLMPIISIGTLLMRMPTIHT